MNTSCNEIFGQGEICPSYIISDSDDLATPHQILPSSHRYFLESMRPAGDSPPEIDNLSSPLKVKSEQEDHIIIRTLSKPLNTGKKNPNSPRRSFLSKIPQINLEQNADMNRLMKDAEPENAEIKIQPSKKSRIARFISLLCLTKKFMRNIRNATIYRRPKWLKSFHFDIINDLSFLDKNLDGVSGKESRLYETFVGIISNLLKLAAEKIKVLHPTSLAHVIFDFVMLITTIACFLIIPIDMGFEIDFLSEMLSGFSPLYNTLLKRMILVLYLAEFFIHLNTAYFEKGELIKSRTLIVKNYFKRTFLRDFVSVIYLILGFRYDYPYQWSLHRLTGLFFLLKNENVSRILARIEEFLFLDEKTHNYLAFVRLIFRIAIISHFFACIWNFIGMNTTDSWIQYMGLQSARWEKRYLISFYYTVVVMNTVGFGDITPKNLYEIAFTIVFIYVACGLFAYTINSIGVILQNINKGESELMNNMLILNGYFRSKKINHSLRTKIKNFLEYVWNDSKVNNEVATKGIMNKLSKSLREELLLNANGFILNSSKLFNNNFSNSTLEKLVYIIKEVKFIPGDTIYDQHQTEEDPCIFIIKEGEVELSIETQGKSNHNIVIEKLGKNKLFGQLSFFSDKPRETTARCTTFTTAYSIRRQNFIDILREHPQDYEKFCMIKDQININDDLSRLYLTCGSCKDCTHFTLFCPFLQLKLSHQRVILKFNYNSNQKRKFFHRNLQRHHFAVFQEESDSSSQETPFDSLSTLPQSKTVIFDGDFPKLLRKRPLPEDEEAHPLAKNVKTRWEVLRSHIKKLPKSKDLHGKSKKDLSEPSEKNLGDLEDCSVAMAPKWNSETEKSAFKNLPSVSLKSHDPIRSSAFSTRMKSGVFQNLAMEPSFDESMRSYQIYFPHNNPEEVIAQANRRIYGNLMKRGNCRSFAIEQMWSNIISHQISDRKVVSPSARGNRRSLKAEYFFKRQETMRISKSKVLKILKDYNIVISKNKLIDYLKKKCLAWRSRPESSY